MASVRDWVEGARLRTLPASASPVIAGWGVAWFVGRYAGPPAGTGAALALVLAVLTLIVGLSLQLGCNFANDYSDGVRGTDAHRVGPMRLVGSGAARPAAVKRAAWLAFGVAALAGLAAVAWGSGLVAALADWPGASALVTPGVLLLIGAACVVAAWFYTGGQRPYGYAGLGEVFVFIFFGLVAVLGTVFLLAPTVCVAGSPTSTACQGCSRAVAWVPGLITGVVMGWLATAILVANNLRDLDSDRAAGKFTLPVKLGERWSRRLYAGLVIAAGVGLVVLAAVTTWWALLALLGVALLAAPVAQVLRGATGPALIGVLKATGLAELATAVLLVAGLGIGWAHG